MARIKSTNVLSFFKEQITLLESSNKLGTARNYRRTLSSFSLFLEGRDIPFRLLDEPLVIRYESWLRSRGVLRNSSSFYMRVLRSVYNKAVTKRLVKQTFPFQNVYTGVDKTRKRAIDEQHILDLCKLSLPALSPLALARDLFLFSYCTREWHLSIWRSCVKRIYTTAISAIPVKRPGSNLSSVSSLLSRKSSAGMPDKRSVRNTFFPSFPRKIR